MVFLWGQFIGEVIKFEVGIWIFTEFRFLFRFGVGSGGRSRVLVFIIRGDRDVYLVLGFIYLYIRLFKNQLWSLGAFSLGFIMDMEIMDIESMVESQKDFILEFFIILAGFSFFFYVLRFYDYYWQCRCDGEYLVWFEGFCVRVVISFYYGVLTSFQIIRRGGRISFGDQKKEGNGFKELVMFQSFDCGLVR